jgi:hypothetical protein
MVMTKAKSSRKSGSTSSELAGFAEGKKLRRLRQHAGRSDDDSP